MRKFWQIFKRLNDAEKKISILKNELENRTNQLLGLIDSVKSLELSERKNQYLEFNPPKHKIGDLIKETFIVTNIKHFEEIHNCWETEYTVVNIKTGKTYFCTIDELRLL